MEEARGRMWQGQACPRVMAFHTREVKRYLSFSDLLLWHDALKVPPCHCKWQDFFLYG